MTRKPYPSNLTDREWRTLEPPLPAYWTDHPRQNDLREIADAILYIVRTGCQWRMPPTTCPPGRPSNTASTGGGPREVWERVSQELRRRERVRRGTEPDPSAVVIDTQSVKTMENGGLLGTTLAST